MVPVGVVTFMIRGFNQSNSLLPAPSAQPTPVVRSIPKSKVQQTPSPQTQTTSAPTQNETAATLRAWQNLQAIHYRQASRNLPPSALYGAAAQEYTMVSRICVMGNQLKAPPCKSAKTARLRLASSPRSSTRGHAAIRKVSYQQSLKKSFDCRTFTRGRPNSYVAL